MIQLINRKELKRIDGKKKRALETGLRLLRETGDARMLEMSWQKSSL